VAHRNGVAAAPRWATRWVAPTAPHLRSGHAPSLVSLVSLLSLLTTGCLPSSRRGQTVALLPSDSLSRRAAAGAEVDTLRREWVASEDGLQLPTSIAWMPPDSGAAAGRLVVADTRAGALRMYDAADGSVVDTPGPAVTLAFPYIAGASGDSLVVLLRGEDRLVWVPIDGGPIRVARSVPIPAGATAAVATDAGLWVKRADERRAWLVRLRSDGREAARHPLPGPSWRRIGFLRARGDTLLSLSGYRPVVDVVAPTRPNGRPPDTLALVGFDSPQLLRSHRYIRGEVDQPPLLTSAAVPLGDQLLVINLRGDELRIDVFGWDGRLQRALVYPAVAETRDGFPVDLAARRHGSDVLLALVMQRPGGLMSDPGGYVLMLRWPGPPAVAETAR
jgi:hypothetical protein